MIEGTDIGGIYIVHGIKGYEAREQPIKDLLQRQHGLDFEFVTESDNQAENDAWINTYFREDIREILPRGGMYCTLVHLLIYEKIVRNDNKLAIIFENDVCFIEPNFVEKIRLIAKEAGELEEGFIISLENSTLNFPSWRKIQKGKYLYKESKGRCAGAYLIDKKAAELMLNDAKTNKCSEVIDWWHNDLIRRGVLNMYWAHPPLTEQGSFNGKHSSSISIRSNGYIRRFRWLSQKFVKMYVTRWLR
jgi:glycosyl transferase family 25